jgi:hypothetical protein
MTEGGASAPLFYISPPSSLSLPFQKFVIEQNKKIFSFIFTA